MKNTQPKIGVVIIGINVEKYLADCIRSVRSADYPQALVEIVYVDGGSRDSSPAIARAIDGVTVIELNDRMPTRSSTPTGLKMHTGFSRIVWLPFAVIGAKSIPRKTTTTGWSTWNGITRSDPAAILAERF